MELPVVLQGEGSLLRRVLEGAGGLVWAVLLRLCSCGGEGAWAFPELWRGALGLDLELMVLWGRPLGLGVLGDGGQVEVLSVLGAAVQ